jgi:hypothetical protein
MIKTIKYGVGLQRTLWKLKINTASFWKFWSVPGMVTLKWIWGGGVRTSGIFDKRLSLVSSCQVVGTLHFYQYLTHVRFPLTWCDWGKSNESAVFVYLWSRALLCSQRLVYTSSRQVISVWAASIVTPNGGDSQVHQLCEHKLNSNIACRANREWMFVKQTSLGNIWQLFTWSLVQYNA